MQNESFRPDYSNPHQNVIVNSHWPVDRNYAYREGFKQAVLVLLSAAAVEYYTDPITEEPLHISIDLIFYPISFNARHYMELFLKDSIRATSALGVNATDGNIRPTHDLKGLWEAFASAIARDSRLVELGMPLEGIFKNISAVDNDSMTFRYAHDLDNNPHLSDFGHVSLSVLGDRLREMFDQAEMFDLCLESLQHEYAQNTFTEKLHRGNLEAIARRLPSYDKWKIELKLIKKEICETLKISSNDFRKALTIIKQHREFSYIIGLELPLEGLPLDVFTRLARVHSREANHDVITKDEWLRLEAVMEIGRLNSYSEEYDPILKAISLPESDGRFDPEHLARNAYARNQRLREGLLKLGQRTLLQALEEAIPYLALPLKKPPKRTPEEISAIAAAMAARLVPTPPACRASNGDEYGDF